MKRLRDLKCERCGCVASLMWIDGEALDLDDAASLHTCPDGKKSDSFTMTTAIAGLPGLPYRH